MIRLPGPESNPDGRPAPSGAAACPAAGAGTMRAMASSDRVCPYCGEPPGAGVFCAACGRNLAAVERLPTREQWERGATGVLSAAADPGPSDPGSSEPPATMPSVSPSEATSAFLEAMRAAGNPGTARLPVPDAPREGFLRRTPEAEGWVVRPVVWDDRDDPKRHEPGLLLTTGGTYHRIDSQIRGWGQRNFPVFHDTAAAETLDPPDDGRLPADLYAVLIEHGAASG
jgi:hypothetical protein